MYLYLYLLYLYLSSPDYDHPDHHISQLETTLQQYARKLTVYEVNESILCRQFTTLKEQHTAEVALRLDREKQFIDMEGLLKRRILWLEKSKTEMIPKIQVMQGLLDVSIPHQDYVLVEHELDSLRQDHLAALRRELSARVANLDSLENARQVRALKSEVLHLKEEVLKNQLAYESTHKELLHQNETTQRALALKTEQDSKNSGGNGHASRGRDRSMPSGTSELGAIVTEMATFRGEASRLQVELVSKEYKCEQLEIRLKEACLDLEVQEEKLEDLQRRCQEAEVSEQKVRQSSLEVETKYSGGLIREDAEALREEAKALREKVSNLELQSRQYQEMAQIAYEQAQSLSKMRETYVEELESLRAHLVQQESRSDDDLIIGKLQRQLMATKTAYKAFTRKYQVLRSNMRQRELTQRVLEHRLDEREKGVLQLQENSRVEISALRKALLQASEAALVTKHPSAIPISGSHTSKSKSKALTPLTHLPSVPISSMSDQFSRLSEQLAEFARLAETANERAATAEKKFGSLEGEHDQLLLENSLLRKEIKEVKVIIDVNAHNQGGKGPSSGSSSKQQMQSKQIAGKLLALSEENRTLKLGALQQKREQNGLQQEKKHLQAVINRYVG